MKRFKKPLILLLIIGFLVAGIAAFFILNSTPDSMTEAEQEEAVAQILGRKPNLNPEIKTGDTEFDGEFLRFSYPARAVEYEYVDPGMANNESVVEGFSFDIENPRLVLNYIASKKDIRSLLDEPGVKLREQENRGYVKEEITLDEVGAFVYKKEGGGSVKAEISTFMLNDGVIYSISITGNSFEDVKELHEQIINSAEFK